MKEIQLNEIKYGDIIEIKSLEDYEEDYDEYDEEFEESYDDEALDNIDEE